MQNFELFWFWNIYSVNRICSKLYVERGKSTLSPSNNRSTFICYFLNGDSKINSKGEKENEILNFSPYLLVPLDTLISLPPSFLMPCRAFACRKNEAGKTEEEQWLMKRTRYKWQFLWMEPLATCCLQGTRPQNSSIFNGLQKFPWRAI